MIDSGYCQECGLQRGAELAAIFAVTTAMIVNPGKDPPLCVDAYVDTAVPAVHLFIVLLAALSVNISFN